MKKKTSSVVIRADGSRHYHHKAHVFARIWKMLKRLRWWWVIAAFLLAQPARAGDSSVYGSRMDVRITSTTAPITISGTVTSSPATAGNITKSSQTVGLASIQMLAGNANRKGWDCESLAVNTSSVTLNIGAAAVLTDQPVLYPGDFYGEYIVVSTGSINVIASAVGQVVRCREKY